MNHVRINAKVVTDDTGIQTEIPVILIEHDGRIFELEPLVDYFLANIQAKSLSWAQKLCQGSRCCSTTCRKLCYFSNQPDLFATFARRVSTGTIGEDGRDPSGLYWLPKRTKNARNCSFTKRILGLDEPEVRDKTAQPLARSHDP